MMNGQDETMVGEKDKKWTALVLSDGKAGHETLSWGAASALERIVKLTTERLQLRLRFKGYGWLLRQALVHFGASWPPPRIWKLLHLCYEGLPTRLLHLPDVIISAGGDTAAANALLAEYWNVPNIYCSSLRGLPPHLFTCPITTEPAPAAPSVITVEFAPVPFDREALAAAGKKFAEQYGQAGCQNVVAVLIGGDGAGYTYHQEDYKRMTEGACELARRTESALLISTSRRTARSGEEAVRRCLHEQSGQTRIWHTVYFNENPEKCVAAYLDLADTVVVTEDSGSMITEAVLAGKPVFTVRPPHVKDQSRYVRFLAKLEQNQRIQRISIEELASENLGQASFNLVRHEPLDDLADELKQRLASKLGWT